jgi:hypothetical protein
MSLYNVSYITLKLLKYFLNNNNNKNNNKCVAYISRGQLD